MNKAKSSILSTKIRIFDTKPSLSKGLRRSSESSKRYEGLVEAKSIIESLHLSLKKEGSAFEI